MRFRKACCYYNGYSETQIRIEEKPVYRTALSPGLKGALTSGWRISPREETLCGDAS